MYVHGWHMTAAEIDLIARKVGEQLQPRFTAIDERFTAIDERFDRMEKKIDDLADVVQGMATGHAKRFDAIERRLDGRPPLELV